MLYKQIISIIVIIGLFMGCTPKHGTDSYDTNEVGTTTRVIEGTLVSIREVAIHGSNETGSSLGAGAGIVAGLNSSRSIEGSIFGAIIGALVGSFVGSKIEEESTKGRGYEFLIRRYDSDDMISFIQEDNNENLQVGDNVLLYIGKTTRISKDNRW